MKKLRIMLNIACIVLSTILAIICFIEYNEIVFGCIFSFVSIHLLILLIVFETKFFETIIKLLK